MPIRKYPQELKERAIRLCRDSDRPVKDIARQLDIGYETLRTWVRRDQRDRGVRHDGPTTAEVERIKELERECAELKRVNEILRLASAFFASEIDQTRR
jgi:transposase